MFEITKNSFKREMKINCFTSMQMTTCVSDGISIEGEDKLWRTIG